MSEITLAVQPSPPMPKKSGCFSPFSYLRELVSKICSCVRHIFNVLSCGLLCKRSVNPSEGPNGGLRERSPDFLIGAGNAGCSTLSPEALAQKMELRRCVEQRLESPVGVFPEYENVYGQKEQIEETDNQRELLFNLLKKILIVTSNEIDLDSVVYDVLDKLGEPNPYITGDCTGSDEGEAEKVGRHKQGFGDERQFFLRIMHLLLDGGFGIKSSLLLKELLEKQFYKWRNRSKEDVELIAKLIECSKAVLLDADPSGSLISEVTDRSVACENGVDYAQAKRAHIELVKKRLDEELKLISLLYDGGLQTSPDTLQWMLQKLISKYEETATAAVIKLVIAKEPQLSIKLEEASSITEKKSKADELLEFLFCITFFANSPLSREESEAALGILGQLLDAGLRCGQEQLAAIFERVSKDCSASEFEEESQKHNEYWVGLLSLLKQKDGERFDQTLRSEIVTESGRDAIRQLLLAS